MTIKEKLETIRNICRGRESCFASGTGEKDCTYCKNCCFPTGYPIDWSDEFIEQLSSQLERPKARFIKTSVSTEVWECSECGKLASGLGKRIWKYCPNCGAEMEE